MSVLRRLQHSVVIESPTSPNVTQNEYGDDDFSNDAMWEAQTVVRCFLMLQSTAEDEDDRETETQTWMVTFGPSVSITGFDRLRFTWDSNEVVARVLGEPVIHYGTRGISHVNVTAERTN